MKTYIGVEMPDINEETIEQIKETEEYKNMPSYPPKAVSDRLKVSGS